MNEFQHGIAEQVSVFPIVEAPRHFLQVRGKVFDRDFMTRAHNTALKQGERHIAGERPVLSVKRSASASPATGSSKAHELEQKTLLSLAFTTNVK